MKQKLIPVAQLEFDPHNPRLPSYVSRTQDDMFEYLAKTSSIEELVSAIAENDFFRGESLIAVETATGYQVVEGNRRLTALKLLNGAVFEGMSARLYDLISSAPHKPNTVPVAVYPNRRGVLKYLGNRHIAGVKPWGALAKARYIKELYDNETDEAQSFLERCRSVARVIGSRRDFIARSMKAIDVYNIAESEDFFGIKEVDETTVKFSFLSTAIDYEGVQAFLYPERDGEVDDNAPVDQERLEELFRFLFVRDRKTGKPRIGESRNLNKLSRVMLHPSALEAFRDGASLDQAYTMTSGVQEDFDTLCFEIQRGLREANALAPDVPASESREDIVGSIYKQARALHRSFE